MVDLLVIGGGVNGVGIARDACGRGLSVVLAERDDLGAATSSASSKLIHGGLRYLEQFEFRLVAEALAERETLLRTARHLVWQARFVMPHVPELRPRWMIRTGLFLYDHLARRSLLSASEAIRLDSSPYGAGLKSEFRHGFVYSDCRVDDSRLVVCNALDAARRGARIAVRTACLSARRHAGGWLAELSSGERVEARALVNASGPWVKRTLDEALHRSTADNVRLVRGSHIVLPRLYEGEHAFILQNHDRRVVFMIPYEHSFTLVGTTDVAQEHPEAALPSEDEVAYLCAAVNRYLAKPVSPSQVVWRFSGVRPLYDDGSADPSAVTRDYTLEVQDEHGAAPVLSIFGGKITTYRRLAETVLERLRPYFPHMGRSWTAAAPLPGSDFDDRDAAERDLVAAYPRVVPEVLRAVFRRHGSLAREVLGDGDIGEHYGAGLCEREVRYLRSQEWARQPEDVLWRRTKAGLHLNPRQQQRVAAALAA